MVVKSTASAPVSVFDVAVADSVVSLRMSPAADAASWTRVCTGLFDVAVEQTLAA